VERLLSSGAISPTTETEERLVRLIESVAAKQQADGTGRTASAWGDELLRLRREQWGADHPRVAATCLTLAAGRLGSGDSEAAIARCREAIAIQEKALKKDHPEVAAGLLIMAEAHRLNGNFDDAAAALSRSLAIWEAKAGTRREVTLVAVRSLAGIRLAQGRGSDALPLLERLLAAGGDTALAQPARHARLLVQLAGALATTDAKERSRRCLNEALALPCFEAANGRADSEIRELVLTLAEAARLLAVLEDQPAATETIRRARGLAIELKSPRDTLALIDEIAAGEKPLPPGRL
jgi:tetratricopeptide (TPR) repeat protein